MELCRNSRPPQHVDPAHKHSDEATHVLYPAKWSVEFVFIVNAKGGKTFICHDRIQKILSPSIQAACHLPPGQILFFPTPPSNGGRFGGRLTPPPRRPLPTRPAIPAQTLLRGPDTHATERLPAIYPGEFQPNGGITTPTLLTPKHPRNPWE
jgi:hypothetical protein